MANVASPYGFKAVNELGGLPYAGSTRQFPIASGYGANIYNGSIVSIVAGGTVQIVTTNGDPISGAAFPAGTIGIFVGCSFTSPATKQKLFSQFWPTGTVAADAVAYVIDDDRAVFQVQSAGSLVAADLGANVFLNAVQSTSTGSTTTGNSNTAVVATAGVIQTTAAFRIVGFVDMQGFSTVGDNFTDVLVKFNPGYHSYSNAVGI
jgi:hypothetical protein